MAAWSYSAMLPATGQEEMCGMKVKVFDKWEEEQAVMALWPTLL